MERNTTQPHWQDLPQDCRIHILGYLMPTELYARFAFTSWFCHRDTLDGALPQTKWGEFCLTCGDAEEGTEEGNTIDPYEISMEALLQRLSHPSFRDAWNAPRRHIKIIGHEFHGSVVKSKQDDLSFEEMQEQIQFVRFPSITSLDISVSEVIIEENEDGLRLPNANRVLPRSLPWILAGIFPGLVELDLSNLHGGPMNEDTKITKIGISELSLFNTINCPHLRIIRWNNRVGGCYFLRGKDMRTLGNLKELYVDNILCDWRFDKVFAPLMNQFFEEDSIIQRYFFFACNSSLEKVSIRGGAYVTMGPLSAKIEFPQWSLMRFVRRSPKLTWFRSDLTKESIDILSKERPEITFC